MLLRSQIGFASFTLSESDVEISADDFPVSVLVVGSCVVDLVVVVPDVGIDAVPFLPDEVLEDDEEDDVDTVLLDVDLEPKRCCEAAYSRRCPR